MIIERRNGGATSRPELAIAVATAEGPGWSADVAQ